MSNPPVSKNPLVMQIAAGAANEELLRFLLDRKLAFTDEEYMEALVFALPMPAFHDRALPLLNSIPRSVKDNYVQKRDAQFQVAEFILQEALQGSYFNTLALIIQNQHLPTEFLLQAAAQGREPTLEVLLDNQVRLIAYPEIMEKMETNPACGPFIRGKIRELREFYFRDQVADSIPETDVLDDLNTIVTQEQNDDESLSRASIQQKTLTSLQTINQMSIAQRITLALTGNKTERLILIKDGNRMVQMAVIESPKMADDEALIHARNLSLSGEIIAKIAGNRDWTKNYSIVMALVQNPKTPISRAIGFMKQLHTRDLKLLMQDRNINPVIRNLAMNLQKQKERVK